MDYGIQREAWRCILEEHGLWTGYGAEGGTSVSSGTSSLVDDSVVSQGICLQHMAKGLTEYLQNKCVRGWG